MNKIKHFFQIVWLRLGSETPKFWKKIIKIMVVIGAFGVSGEIQAIKNLLPDAVQDLPGYLILVGVVGGLLAKLTTKDEILTQEKPMAQIIEEKKEERKEEILENLRGDRGSY